MSDFSPIVARVLSVINNLFIRFVRGPAITFGFILMPAAGCGGWSAISFLQDFSLVHCGSRATSGLSPRLATIHRLAILDGIFNLCSSGVISDVYRGRAVTISRGS
jgi:hypothetical protein